ncbi:structural maintenance of chromosomes protein 6, putative [Plasmodium malariae]|uniref:Structural maintenance of chromosomes protein 6, putative n=1 Tax=Plasmodium malariae TaxID=5858 RepID=A0A1C3KDJ8_PLAMA|nr:structural maintenance of chromosomes protein 6, putative [Plasmodium malariae]
MYYSDSSNSTLLNNNNVYGKSEHVDYVEGENTKKKRKRNEANGMVRKNQNEANGVVRKNQNEANGVVRKNRDKENSIVRKNRDKENSIVRKNRDKENGVVTRRYHEIEGKNEVDLFMNSSTSNYEKTSVSSPSRDDHFEKKRCAKNDEIKVSSTNFKQLKGKNRKKNFNKTIKRSNNTEDGFMGKKHDEVNISIEEESSRSSFGNEKKERSAKGGATDEAVGADEVDEMAEADGTDGADEVDEMAEADGTDGANEPGNGKDCTKGCANQKWAQNADQNYFDFSNLKDADVKSFYGSTGKIIKLRIRNFLNHENLELSFNSSKNIIIGKNGKGKSAIAQAVAVGLGSQGKQAGRDISLANYIKDYDKNKKNLVCNIEIFLSNSGKNSYKRDIYGDIVVIKRVFTSHSSKFFLYGLRQGRNSVYHSETVTTNITANFCTNTDTENMDKRISSNVSTHSRGVKDSGNSRNAVANNSCSEEYPMRQARKKAYIDNYLNVIKLNIRSPCVYLDQEKGKQFFSTINEKALHKFFMSSVGLNIVEDEIEKENEMLQNCLKEIKQKEILLYPLEEELKNMKEKNDMLRDEFDKLKYYDKGYKIAIFYDLLKNTILMFNEYLKAENFKNEKVINSIQNKMNTLVEQSEYLKEVVKLVIEKDTFAYNFIKKNQDKMIKYNEMVKELISIKDRYTKRKDEIVNYVSSFEKAKDNKKLLRDHLNKYKDEIKDIKQKIKIQTDKEIELQSEINKRENSIYEMEYQVSKCQNSVELINKQINVITAHLNKIQKIKNNQIKKKMYIYGYDIYTVRKDIIKNYNVYNESDRSSFLPSLDAQPNLANLEMDGIHRSGSNDCHFKYEPIGPVGEYIKLRGNIENEKILSIIEKHLGDLFYAWLVSCYEDKNILTNIEIENKNKFSIIVTNAFQHVRRDSLLQNIQSLLSKINGNSIYSFLNIDLLPTSLLFYLYDNFKIVQTLICNNSTELQELLRTNDKKIVKSIYVIDDFVLVKVLANGGLHYQPAKEEYYRNPIFLNRPFNENNFYDESNDSHLPTQNDNFVNVPASDSASIAQFTSINTAADSRAADSNPINNNEKNGTHKTNEEELKELEKEKEEMEEEILRTSKKILSYKNIIESLNESLKKCKFAQDELKYQLQNIDELMENHDSIFSEQLDLEIKEKNKDIYNINESVNSIDEYIRVLEGKKRSALDTCSLHKYLISHHSEYLKKKKEQLTQLIEEYYNLKEVLIKLEKDKKKNEEVATRSKKSFLLSLNKLHNVYFECLTSNFLLDDIFLESPFLILKGRNSTTTITNIAIRRTHFGEDASNVDKVGECNCSDNNSPLEGRSGNELTESSCSVKVTFTTESLNKSLCGNEIIQAEVPLSSLSSFNKLFLLSGNDENIMKSKENASLNKSPNLYSNNKNMGMEIKDIKKLEMYIENIMNNNGRVDNKSTCDNIISSNKILFDEDKIEISSYEKYSDILWKKRCEKKKEIIEILKVNGFNEMDNTDNSLKNYFDSLIEQYTNDEKGYIAQMKQINELKNNYDMHLSNIKLRRSKFSTILKKTKEQITVHFKNILKSMNNYKGKIEFDDLNRHVKVLVSINQDISNNIFMEINSLSGGERSTIQMALLASLSLTETSSFHIFDELDVYMDELTRVKNMQQFCEFIERNNDKQYFFITPHIEITELFLGDAKEKKAKILNLS